VLIRDGKNCGKRRFLHFYSLLTFGGKGSLTSWGPQTIVGAMSQPTSATRGLITNGLKPRQGIKINPAYLFTWFRQ